MGKVQNKNPEFSIILGDKIPLKTKLMRDEIKKSAEGSFAITS